MLIEIFVSHVVDDEKKDKIRDSNLSAIEVCIDNSLEPGREAVKKAVLSTENLRWLNCVAGSAPTRRHKADQYFARQIIAWEEKKEEEHNKREKDSG